MKPGLTGNSGRIKKNCLEPCLSRSAQLIGLRPTLLIPVDVTGSKRAAGNRACGTSARARRIRHASLVNNVETGSYYACVKTRLRAC